MKNRIYTWLLFLIGIVAYPQGELKDEPTPQTIKKIEQYCKEGKSEACEKLYYHYFYKEDKDGEKIMHYIKRLSDLKRPKYMFMWGVAMNEGGLGGVKVKEDFVEGMKLIKQSADLDYPPAQMMIGDFLCTSNEAKDIRRGLFYINNACESTYQPACYVMNKVNYTKQEGVTKELRDRVWEGLENCNDPYLRPNRYDFAKEQYKKRKFINN